MTSLFIYVAKTNEKGEEEDRDIMIKKVWLNNYMEITWMRCNKEN